METPHPIPAATLVLFDETAPGPARHLMLQRSASLRFAAGMLVFPGGRVDADDHAIAANPALTSGVPAEADDAAGRIAAIRETLEETGIGIAIEPALRPDEIPVWRAALKAGTVFSQLLAASGRHLALARLLPFARWCPRHLAHRLYDTRFYAARREDESEAVHDADEAAHLLWRTAAEVLREAAAGKHALMFPTLRNLERLAAHPSFAALQAHVAATPWRVITPEPFAVEGVVHLRIPADAGYPVTAAPLEYRG
jgi:8-oxo-dGTP pyrophosphatase MutT (NUDIX family)